MAIHQSSATFVVGVTIGLLAKDLLATRTADKVAARELQEALQESREASATQDSRPVSAAGSSALGRVLGLSANLERRIVRDLQMFGFGSFPPVKVHHHSRTPVEDMFVRLHNNMHRVGLLPLSAWGVGRGPNRKPNVNDDVLSRMGMDLFFDTFASRVRPNAVCLEWGNPHYSKRIPSCRANSTWSFHFSPSRKAINPRKRTVVADLNSLHEVDVSGWPRFDLIICNQVFEHISSPFDSAVAVALLLAPGGLLFFTAPFMEPYHRMPGDFFRYTFDGARTLFERAGLEVVEQRRIGNTMLASAHLLGFGTADVDEGILRRDLIRRIDASKMNRVDEWAFIETALVAQKPVQAPSSGG